MSNRLHLTRNQGKIYSYLYVADHFGRNCLTIFQNTGGMRTLVFECYTVFKTFALGFFVELATELEKSSHLTKRYFCIIAIVLQFNLFRF